MLHSLWNVDSPRLRSSFHPEALQQTYLVNSMGREERELCRVQSERSTFALPTKEDLFYRLNPVCHKSDAQRTRDPKVLGTNADPEVKGKGEPVVSHLTAPSFVELADARIRKNKMEKEVRIL